MEAMRLNELPKEMPHTPVMNRFANSAERDEVER